MAETQVVKRQSSSFGAQITPEGVRFRLWAPAAKTVDVVFQEETRSMKQLGDGWFDHERHGRDSWAWSKGRSIVLVHAGTQRSGTECTLRFRLRALAPQHVTIRLGARVLWQGEVGEKSHADSITATSTTAPLLAGRTSMPSAADSRSTTSVCSNATSMAGIVAVRQRHAPDAA